MNVASLLDTCEIYRRVYQEGRGGETTELDPVLERTVPCRIAPFVPEGEQGFGDQQGSPYGRWVVTVAITDDLKIDHRLRVYSFAHKVYKWLEIRGFSRPRTFATQLRAYCHEVPGNEQLSAQIITSILVMDENWDRPDGPAGVPWEDSFNPEEPETTTLVIQGNKLVSVGVGGVPYLHMDIGSRNAVIESVFLVNVLNQGLLLRYSGPLQWMACVHRTDTGKIQLVGWGEHSFFVAQTPEDVGSVAGKTIRVEVNDDDLYMVYMDNALVLSATDSRNNMGTHFGVLTANNTVDAQWGRTRIWRLEAS